MLTQLCWCEVAQLGHDKGADAGAKGVDTSQGPGVTETERAQNGLVVDGEGQVEQEVHGQPRVGRVNLARPAGGSASEL